ncbi:hypothetical protein PFISCL1PPCAC_19517, partial [Pristionchus fissidentatus]
MQQFAPPPGQTSTGPPTGAATAAAAGYPPSFPGVPSQGGQREGGGGPPNHMTSPPVSVTGGTNQIQVNIKPEQAGHTLISVYQMPPEGSGYAGHSVPPPQVAPPRESTEEHPKSSDSVPPEPIPSYHNAQSSMGGMPLDPYGMTRGAPPNETLANSTTTICPKIEPIELVLSLSLFQYLLIQSCSPSLSESSSSMAPIPNSHPPTDDEATREMIQIKTEPSTSIDDEEEERRRKEEELMDAPPRAPVRIEEMREEEEEEEERREDERRKEEEREKEERERERLEREEEERRKEEEEKEMMKKKREEEMKKEEEKIEVKPTSNAAVVAAAVATPPSASPLVSPVEETKKEVKMEIDSPVKEKKTKKKKEKEMAPPAPI